MENCLLANTILRDMILTSLLWRNFQTKKLLGRMNGLNLETKSL